MTAVNRELAPIGGIFWHEPVFPTLLGSYMDSSVLSGPNYGSIVLWVDCAGRITKLIRGGEIRYVFERSLRVAEIWTVILGC